VAHICSESPRLHARRDQVLLTNDYCAEELLLRESDAGLKEAGTIWWPLPEGSVDNGYCRERGSLCLVGETMVIRYLEISSALHLDIENGGAIGSPRTTSYAWGVYGINAPNSGSPSELSFSRHLHRRLVVHIMFRPTGSPVARLNERSG
jgi:hypothetical protein